VGGKPLAATDGKRSQAQATRSSAALSCSHLLNYTWIIGECVRVKAWTRFSFGVLTYQALIELARRHPDWSAVEGRTLE